MSTATSQQASECASWEALTGGYGWTNALLYGNAVARRELYSKVPLKKKQA